MINKNDNLKKNKQLDRIVEMDNDVKQITIGDQRYYSQNSVFYPSVTYILSYYPKGPQFEKWLKANGENATQIAANAAEKGTNVHRAIEQMLEGKKPQWIADNGYANYSLEEWRMILRFADFWNTRKPKLIHSELHVFSYYYKYAGTIDLVVEMDGELWVIDIKTSNNVHMTYELQVDAYKAAYNEHYNPTVRRTGILWLNSNTRKPSSDASKLQGRGWQLVTSTRSFNENMNIFSKVYDIFKLENKELKPLSEKYPNDVELDLS